MADSRNPRFTTDEVLFYFERDENKSVRDSSDEELDFRKYIGVVDVSDVSSDDRDVSSDDHSDLAVDQGLFVGTTKESPTPPVIDSLSTDKMQTEPSSQDTSLLESSVLDVFQSSNSEDSVRSDSEPDSDNHFTEIRDPMYASDDDSFEKNIESEVEDSNSEENEAITDVMDRNAEQSEVEDSNSEENESITDFMDGDDRSAVLGSRIPRGRGRGRGSRRGRGSWRGRSSGSGGNTLIVPPLQIPSVPLIRNSMKPVIISILKKK